MIVLDIVLTALDTFAVPTPARFGARRAPQFFSQLLEKANFLLRRLSSQLPPCALQENVV